MTESDGGIASEREMVSDHDKTLDEEEKGNNSMSLKAELLKVRIQ